MLTLIFLTPLFCIAHHCCYNDTNLSGSYLLATLIFTVVFYHTKILTPRVFASMFFTWIGILRTTVLQLWFFTQLCRTRTCESRSIWQHSYRQNYFANRCTSYRCSCTKYFLRLCFARIFGRHSCVHQWFAHISLLDCTFAPASIAPHFGTEDF